MLQLAIKKFLQSRNVQTVDFRDPDATNFVRIANRGEGVEEIAVWKVPGITQPTQGQLASFLAEANNEQRVIDVQTKRFYEYPDIREQLDMIFNDIENNRLNDKVNGNFYKAIKAIKDRHPLPV